MGRGTQLTKPSNSYLDIKGNSKAAPSVKAHHGVQGPETGRNSKGRWIKKRTLKDPFKLLDQVFI